MVSEKPGDIPLEDVLTSPKKGMGENLVSVILFGSRTRGEGDETSDWDLLVLAEDRLNRLKRLIQHKGLVRESIGRDLVWRREIFPGFGWSLQWEEAHGDSAPSGNSRSIRLFHTAPPAPGTEKGFAL